MSEVWTETLSSSLVLQNVCTTQPASKTGFCTGISHTHTHSNHRYGHLEQNRYWSCLCDFTIWKSVLAAAQHWVN